jgi:uncharacterized protein (TIGR02246 family)
MNRTVGAAVCVLGAACAAAADEARMEDRQVAALREMTDAVNAGDAARYARVYADDATITIFGSSELAGRAAIEAHEVGLLREFPGARLAFHDVWQDGERAAVHYAVTGKTPQGKVMGHEGLLFYRFQPSGLVAEERRYLDGLTPMAQLGALGSVPARSLPALPSRMTAHLAQGSPEEHANRDNAAMALAALDSGDETAFESGFARDAMLDELMLLRPFAGPSSVREYFRTWSGAVGSARSEVGASLVAGDTVLFEVVLSGALTAALGGVSAPNQRFRVHRALLVRLDHGKITRFMSFINGKELAQAVGQWPPPPAR